MAFQIPALDLLIHELCCLPGIGEKTAQRLAFHILKAGPDYSQRLAQSLLDVRAQVKYCQQCFSYTDQELCRICSNSSRDARLICVVEEPADVLRFEAIGTFRGLYHVLLGTISPLDGVGPDQLKVRELTARVETLNPASQPIELIMSLDADLEGDTTALYISKIFSGKGVKITRLAHGVPFGSDIDYIDPRTLGRAFENRVEI
ncbi:MAG: recombination mediator RecR [Bdellovibrionales bacterium]